MVCHQLCLYNDLVSLALNPPSATSRNISDPSLAHLKLFLPRFQQAPWLLLYFAADYGKKEMLETILESCCSTDASFVNRQNERDGNTAMHLALRGGHVACIQTLLYFYPDLTIVNKSGETILNIGAKEGRWEALKVLLKHGLNDISELQKDGAVLKWAVQAKQVEIIHKLLELGADVNMRAAKVSLTSI